eukprot:Anaeramoba_ignava/a347912_76.p2 GENE.a347912_76~~a347912_76.p2  ORF type:complete len:274 (+),score=69.64 a347912_76:2267-3088(+)
MRVLKELSFIDRIMNKSNCLADLIVKLFDQLHLTKNLISFIVDNETQYAVSKDSIFRGNLFSSTMAASIAKLYGIHFLKRVVEPIILEIQKEGTMKEKFLKKHVTTFLSQILGSDDLFPRTLHWLCYELRSKLEEKYPEEDHLPSVGSFLFTRFVSPSLTSPLAYGLLSDAEPSQSLSDTLLQVAKVLQVLANNTKFGALSNLVQFNDFIDEQRPAFLEFISNISNHTYQSKPMDSIPGDYYEIILETAKLINLNMEHIQSIFETVKQEIQKK